MNKKLSTQPYKGVRDFYPEDMAIQRYIFDVWSQTAESFGFECYDASILEPADLYKAKGAENEEMVNEQSYTFIDRGEREVTLRPEMTPTVARMIAGKRQELSFPVRWYSIPNLFRYERAQRGRLREHWQLNCDIFGSEALAADVEIISLAYQVFMNFGATPDMFEIRVNDRALMDRLYKALGLTDDMILAITRLNDRRRKISAAEYTASLEEITNDETLAEEIIMMLDRSDEQSDVVLALNELGIENVVFDKSLARGFDYYTGTVFEFFDTSTENKRALLGGGRYDNLTALFGGETVSGVGFGFGDVTIRDFLETHGLLTSNITAPELVIIPMGAGLNLAAEKLAQSFRAEDISTSVDFGTRKLGKKIGIAAEALSDYVLILGEDEIKSEKYTIKNLADGKEISGTVKQLLKKLA
ncbi:histidine--tRNA ligase [Candidatus Kaiserbacteria bacterium]|nr:histidine--tRNA ligase [Candidatus Kaiserbacteria bacterium]